MSSKDSVLLDIITQVSVVGIARRDDEELVEACVFAAAVLNEFLDEPLQQSHNPTPAAKAGRQAARYYRAGASE